PWAFAMLRTTGEDFVRRRSSNVDGADRVAGAEAATGSDVAATDPVGAAAATGGRPTGADVAATDPGCAAGSAPPAEGFSPFAPMVATTEFTGTVSPSLTLMSRRIPAPGDGISASTLSVEISNSGSS